MIKRLKNILIKGEDMNEQGLDLEQVAAAEELEGEEKSPRLKRIELIIINRCFFTSSI